MKLTAPLKLLITAWAMNFFALCSTHFLTKLDYMKDGIRISYGEANPIMAFAMQYNLQWTFHIALWVVLFLVFFRFERKDESYFTLISKRKYLFLFSGIIFIHLGLDFLNDLYWFLLELGFL